MGTSLNSFVYDVLSTIEGASRLSDDIEISNEQIEYLACNNRAFLIRQDQNKGRSLSDNVIQVLSCVEVIEVDASECCDIQTECHILRTKNRIPRPIEVHQKDLIVRVAGIDMLGKGWSIVPYARAIRSGISKHTKNTTRAFFHNGYVYIINAPVGIKKISISLVAEDPREAGQFANCSGNPCYTNDDSFPISNHMLPLLKDLVLKDLKIMVSVPSDQRGNESQKTQPQTEN